MHDPLDAAGVTTHRGWFPVEEAAIRKLRDTFDEPSAYRMAFLLHVTLCRVANLEGDDTFVRRIASIAQDAGLSYRSAADGLGLLETAGLVRIEEQLVPGSREKAPSRYTLLRMSGTDCGTSGTDCPTLGKSRVHELLPINPKNVLQEQPKELLQEGTSAEPPRQKPRPSVLSDDAFWEALRKNPAYARIDIDREMGRMDAWILAHPGRQRTRRRIVNWLNRAERPVGGGTVSIVKFRATTQEEHERGF